jgi:hypothetical protein
LTRKAKLQPETPVICWHLDILAALASLGTHFALTRTHVVVIYEYSEDIHISSPYGYETMRRPHLIVVLTFPGKELFSNAFCQRAQQV